MATIGSTAAAAATIGSTWDLPAIPYGRIERRLAAEAALEACTGARIPHVKAKANYEVDNQDLDMVARLKPNRLRKTWDASDP